MWTLWLTSGYEPGWLLQKPSKSKAQQNRMTHWKTLRGLGNTPHFVPGSDVLLLYVQHHWSQFSLWQETCLFLTSCSYLFMASKGSLPEMLILAAPQSGSHLIKRYISPPTLQRSGCPRRGRDSLRFIRSIQTSAGEYPQWERDTLLIYL